MPKCYGGQRHFFPTAVEGCPKITLILNPNPNPNPKNLKINETSFYRGGNKIVACGHCVDVTVNVMVLIPHHCQYNEKLSIRLDWILSLTSLFHNCDD